MAIETQTPAVQLALTGKARIADRALQVFAQQENALTAAQAAPIDAALTALSAALLAAGVGGTPVDPTVASVANGASVPVKNSAGTVTKTGTAAVALSAVTGVTLPATSAIVDNAAAVTVQNSAGTSVPGTHPATVAAGAVSNVKLAATVAAVANSAKVNAGSVTGTGNFATFTVAAGVITGIVLSAS